jgi:hypothetical protein
MLYEFCEFFGLQYAIGIGTNSRLQSAAQGRQHRLAKRYRRTGEPQRSFSSFRYRAHTWSHQRRICYKAEHTAAGTNLRFLVTNLSGRSRSVFSFYNDRGECENRMEEFKNGFAADRLSCHRFRANAFRLLLHKNPSKLKFVTGVLPLPTIREPGCPERVDFGLGKGLLRRPASEPYARRLLQWMN